MPPLQLTSEEIALIRDLHNSGNFGIGLTYAQALMKWAISAGRHVPMEYRVSAAWMNDYHTELAVALTERTRSAT